MNQTAGANAAEIANSLRPQATVEHTERAQHELELSRQRAAQTVFKDITETFGISFVPDLFATLEGKPAYLEAAWELFKDEVCLDALDARTRQIVALAITTNASGMYQIVALPNAFRLSPVGLRRCDTIVSMIRMVQAFDRYLSDCLPLHTPAMTTSGTTTVLTSPALRRPT
jgi:hypothetical protein